MSKKKGQGKNKKRKEAEATTEINTSPSSSSSPPQPTEPPAPQTQTAGIRETTSVSKATKSPGLKKPRKPRASTSARRINKGMLKNDYIN